MTRRRPRCAIALAFVVASAGCAGDATTVGDTVRIATSGVDPDFSESTAPERSTAPPTTPTTAPLRAADASTRSALAAELERSPRGCDPLDPRQCVLPFPSDAYAEVDPRTPTERRVALPSGALPINAAGAPIDVTAWNDNDGFSANTPILTWVADLDPAASDLPSWTDLEASLAGDASVVLIEQSTGERVPLWAEPALDDDGQPSDLLTVHPAISLEPSTTYSVGMRNLVDGVGDAVEPGAAFAVYRDELETGIETIEARRADMETTFAALDDAGIDRGELQLAWSFTTASTENTTDRILAMRDETLAGLEDAAPEFQITSVRDAPVDGLARLVEGLFSVPSYLQGDGGPGQPLNLDADGRPEIVDVIRAPFACGIADAVLATDEPAHAVVYGHGLLGSHLEITAENVVAMSNEHNAMYCATTWAGFSENDIPTAIRTLEDLSNFPTFIDGMHQGLLNQMVLGRLMLADNGLRTEPGFRRTDGSSLFDNSTIAYDGNSQGGIMGMALAALSPDIERAVLGVVGMNYSLLLPRSVDFDAFDAVFVPAYPDPADRAIAIAATQMLWDRTDGAGYVRHLVDDPLPNTPTKDVLLHVAFGDWQVSELTAMIAARTMGIPIHRPVAGRSREVEPGWGIDTVDYTSDSSALIVWDSGSDPIPVEPTPPSTTRDPHGDPRNDPAVRRQKAAFLFDAELIDVCADGPCTASPR